MDLLKAGVEVARLWITGRFLKSRFFMFRAFSGFEKICVCFDLDISSVRRNPHTRRGTVAVVLLLHFHALPACGRQASVCLKLDSCASCLGDRSSARAPSSS